MKAKLLDYELKLREKTTKQLADHSLVRDFHTYREAKRAELEGKLLEFSLKHQAQAKTPADQAQIEKLKRDNRNLKLDCFRVQKMLVKA